MCSGYIVALAYDARPPEPSIVGKTYRLCHSRQIPVHAHAHSPVPEQGCFEFITVNTYATSNRATDRPNAVIRLKTRKAGGLSSFHALEERIHRIVHDVDVISKHFQGNPTDPIGIVLSDQRKATVVIGLRYWSTEGFGSPGSPGDRVQTHRIGLGIACGDPRTELGDATGLRLRVTPAQIRFLTHLPSQEFDDLLLANQNPVCRNRFVSTLPRRYAARCCIRIPEFLKTRIAQLHQMPTHTSQARIHRGAKLEFVTCGANLHGYNHSIVVLKRQPDNPQNPLFTTSR